MTTIIENWQKHLESQAELINANSELSKDEKAAQIHSDRAQMVHRSRVTLGDYKSKLVNERDKLDGLVAQRNKKTLLSSN